MAFTALIYGLAGGLAVYGGNNRVTMCFCLLLYNVQYGKTVRLLQGRFINAQYHFLAQQNLFGVPMITCYIFQVSLWMKVH